MKLKWTKQWNQIETPQNQNPPSRIRTIPTLKLRIKHCKIVSINIIKFYKFYDVEIYELPKINEKSVQKPQPIYFSDLPDKEIISKALGIASPMMKAVILFIAYSGCARAETLSLTIQDYIDELSEYLPRRNMDIFEVIDIIEDDEIIIPTFNIRRIKINMIGYQSVNCQSYVEATIKIKCIYLFNIFV